MNTKYFTRMLQAAAITLALVAVCQEIEKPEEERTWHGTIAGFIPYDFRIPTIERFKERFWNSFENHIITPEVFGVGWAINFHALLENMRLIGQEDVSEEDFLMPTQSIKELLIHSPETG